MRAHLHFNFAKKRIFFNRTIKEDEEKTQNNNITIQNVYIDQFVHISGTKKEISFVRWNLLLLKILHIFRRQFYIPWQIW